MSEQQTPQVREKVWLALVLAWTAGCVDAVSYLVLWKVFTAHMSGNSVAWAVSSGMGESSHAWHRAFAIPMFVLGVAAGAALSEMLARSGVRRIFTVAVTLEASLLLIFLLWGGALLHEGAIPPEPAWRFYLLIALVTLAMGVQNATLRRVGGVTVRTTYISGMLTNFAEQSVQYVFWLRDHWEAHRGHLGVVLRLSRQQKSFRRVCLHGSIWVVFTAGAILGVWATLRWGLVSLMLAVVCLGAIAFCDIVSPIYPPREGADKPEWT